MKKQIFIINGSGGTGKDTFVNYVSGNILLRNFSSVAEVKKIARAIGWNGRKSEKDRKFLSDLKILCTEYNDMPFNSIKEEVLYFNRSNASLLFLHIREPKEIERAKKAFGAKTILLIRDNVKPITTNMADANVDNYNYDITIVNNGDLSDLKMAAFCFAEDFKKNDLQTCYGKFS